MPKKIIFWLIICAAILLRFYNLGINPPSLDWDEVSTGYNAYSLWLTGQDEYDKPWPISIRSFGDYKPPLYTYLTIPSVVFFGLNEFSVRFPSAVFGTLTVFAVYFLTYEFFFNSTHRQTYSLLAAAVFAIAPWPLQFSRAAFEGTLAVFFVTTGMYLMLRWLRRSNLFLLYTAALVLSISLYTYHAARLIVPLLAIGIFIRYFKHFHKNLNSTLIAIFIAIIILIPLLLSFFIGSDAARFSSVSIFKPTTDMLRIVQYENEDIENANILFALTHNRRVEYFKEFVAGYMDHFNVMYMFILGDIVPRHHAPGVGLFYFIELLFILIGIYSLIKKKFNGKFLFFWWAFIGPLPAAISTGTPHAIRSILTLPIPHIAIAFGIYKFVSTIKSIQWTQISRFKKYLPLTAILIIIMCYLLNFSYYLIQYYAHQPVEYASDWQYGYKEMVAEVEKIKNNFDQIIITNFYDQPYIYFLFYSPTAYDPRIIRNDGNLDQGWGNYTFRRIKWENDRKLKNTLLVGVPMEIPEGEPGQIHTIKFPDGTDAFRMLQTPQN